MHEITTTTEHADAFPHVGFRARRWLRFERDLRAWLDTPEGRFEAWCAAQQVASEPARSS
jgi:hypothetical protein